MIKSYITLAIRSFRKGNIVSVINLLGLATGLASVMLIVSYINYELSFDKHYPDSDRIYELVMEMAETVPAIRTNSVPAPLGKTLKQEFAEIEATTSFSPGETTFLLKDQPKSLNTLTVGPDFFKIFQLSFVKGNPKTALNRESDIVITEDAESRLFPGKEAVGQSLTRKTFEGEIVHYVITGVIKNIPNNTHFSADVINMGSAEETQKTLDFSGYTAFPQYVLIKKNIDVAKLEAKLSGALKKYGLTDKNKISFLKATDIHLYSGDIISPNLNTGNIRYVYIFGSVALLILVIGCMNYVNLTTAQSLQRTKEVGVRKTLGSRRIQLTIQFIGESFLFFFIALLLAFILAAVLWPLFNAAMRIHLPIGDLFSLQNILLFIGTALIAGVISGLYPAIFLSGMQPAGILKTHQNRLAINFSLRKTLIVLQFSISVVLVIATIVVWQQLSLFKNRSLGFDKEHLLVLKPIMVKGNPSAFKKTILDNANILSASFVNMELGQNHGHTATSRNPFDSTQRLDFAFVQADFDFIKTMGIRIKEGRNYNPAFTTDHLNIDSLNEQLRAQATKKRIDPDKLEYFEDPIIITESLAKKLRLNNPVDTVLHEGGVQGKVIGVLQDFQLTTLKKESPLLVYRLNEGSLFANTYIRLNNKNIPESIRSIEKTWYQFFPDQVFQYSFADESLQKLYESESRLASIFSSFALLAIGISALGLFSLVALIVRQRFKEIGIRKVMGASVPEVVFLLSKDFLVLIIISVLIASPMAWYGAKQWLQDFANRIDVQWWFFAVAGVLALLTGLLTVSYQTIKAAKMNPVDVLRSE
jgi:putative ABC transport system permease protein